jgi:phage terminase small subunit
LPSHRTPITLLQERFCQEYLVDFNAKQAAIRAGYSAATASAAANKLLTTPKIQARLQTLQKPLKKKLKISAERVLQELAAIAFCNPKDYLAWTSTSIEVVNSDLLEDTKAVAIASVSCSTSQQKGTVVELKFHDKLKALQLICDRYLNLDLAIECATKRGYLVVPANELLESRLDPPKPGNNSEKLGDPEIEAESDSLGAVP